MIFIILYRVKLYPSIHVCSVKSGNDSHIHGCPSPLQDVQARGGVERSTSVGGSSVGGSGMNSLLPIVSSQRERFKQRNVELEAVSW